MYDLGIINGKTYTYGTFVETNVFILEGKIAAISPEVLPSKELYDAKDKLVIPGLIDPHVHFELGVKKTSVDDFYSGSVCGAYGGFTTFFDFLDPIHNGRELKAAYVKRHKLAKKSIINYGFHTTVANPKNVKDIVDKMKIYDMKSVKLFTTYSESQRRTYDPEIKEFLEYSSLGDFVVMAHIEKDALITLSSEFKVEDLPKSRPSEAELEEALHLAALVKETKGRLYMVHLSSGNTLKQLKEKYKEELNTSFFVESCPHYFVLSNEKYNQEEGYLYTMAPPLRSEHEMKALNQEINQVYSIGTDHCSYRRADKNQEKLLDIPMGVGGIEHSFDIMYHLFKEKCIDKMTINPALMFGLYPRKGHIGLGADADIMIYDPTKQCVIEKGHSQSDYSIYDNLLVDGRVESTIIEGQFVLCCGKLLGGQGKYVGDPRL